MDLGYFTKFILLINAYQNPTRLFITSIYKI